MYKNPPFIHTKWKLKSIHLYPKQRGIIRIGGGGGGGAGAAGAGAAGAAD